VRRARLAARQLDLVAVGAQAVGGLIEVDPGDLPPEVLRRRETRLGERLAATRAGDGDAEHPFFSGASLGITVAAYSRAGGLRPVAALEDQALERTLTDRGIPIARSRAVRVRTSGRTDGRAPHGLSADLRVDSWTERRGFSAAAFDARALAERKTDSVSVVLPCREVAATIGPILAALRPLEDIGLIDEVLVVDAASRDGTAEIAEGHGARLVQESAILPQFGPCRGKGDAMWRALAVTAGAVVAYIDADTREFDARFALGLIAPLVMDSEVALVKGAFRRPLQAGGALLADEGGRVTELVARPLLSMIAPELGGFVQPLAGETAGRRDLLEELAFPVGYGVEIAMLIDALRARGLDALAQVDLGVRLNRHQSLRELGAMALAVMGAGLRRGLPAAQYEALAPGRMLVPTADGAVRTRDVTMDERPPMADVRRGSLTAVR
jgi:glucosyl-3-phosphoglycerate synthase